MSAAFDRPERARRTVLGLVVAAVAGYGGLIAAGRPVAAVVVWVVGLAGATIARWQSPAPLFDERDEAVSQRAAAVTLTLVGLTSAVVFPALAAASGLGAFEWEPWATTAALLIAGIYLVFGLALVVVRGR